MVQDGSAPAWYRRALLRLLPIVLIAAAVGALVWLSIQTLPTEWPPASETDRWVALSALIALATLLFALVAAWVAVLAFMAASESPHVGIVGFEYPGRDGTLDGAHPNWSIQLRLQNSGRVSARYIAVRLTLSGGHFEPAGGEEGLAPWSAPERGAFLHQLLWEGGPGAVLHPGWDYQVPSLPGGRLVLDPGSTRIDVVVEVVADNVETIRDRGEVRLQTTTS